MILSIIRCNMTLLVFLSLAHVCDYGDFFLIKSLHLTTYLTWIVLSVREKLFFPYKKTFLVYLASSWEYKQFIFSFCYSWRGGGSCALPQGMINDSAKILFSNKIESSPQTDHLILFKNVHFSSYIHNVDRTRPTRTGFWKNKKDFQVSQLYDFFLSMFPKVFQA